MKRIIAEFVPQAWVNDYTITVDAEGETKFDVTNRILEMGREAALALRDDTYETDNLRDLAPTWAQDWGGPFYVRVEMAIEEYFS
jgi:hypothetical protein